MKIVMATKNPAKLEGAKKAFECFFEDVIIEGISVPSDVPDQPVNEDILNGAKNRVNNLISYCKESNITADYYISIESGIHDFFNSYVITNIALIRDSNGYESIGTSPSFPVPNKYVDDIISTDLGTVMDNIFKENDLRSKKGGINFLTHSNITRIDLTRGAFIMALTQFINSNIWKD